MMKRIGRLALYAMMLAAVTVQGHEAGDEKRPSSRLGGSSSGQDDAGAASLERSQPSRLRPPVHQLHLHYENEDEGHHDHDHHHHEEDHDENSNMKSSPHHDPFADDDPSLLYYPSEEDINEGIYSFLSTEDRHLAEASTEPIRRCSQKKPTPQEEDVAEEATARYRKSLEQQHDRFLSVGPTIPVYWHVMMDANNQGFVSDDQIDQSMQVLNDAFNPHGFQFVRATIQRTVEPAFYTATPAGNAYGTEDVMKEKYRVGDAATLNVYTNAPGGGLLGWASFPSWYKDWPYYDGVVINHYTVPGGGTTHYSEGDTLVHEVGHWLGLYHTFQGGCSGGWRNIGDGVDDTPFQADPSHGCKSPTTDSCPDQPGNDPVTNYMNYLFDRCMFEFTPGQAERMEAQWEAFRAPLETGPTVPPTTSPTASPTGPTTETPTASPTTFSPTTSPTTGTPSQSPSTAAPVATLPIYVTDINVRVTRQTNRYWESRILVTASERGALVKCNYHNQVFRYCRTNWRKRCACGRVRAGNGLQCYNFSVDEITDEGYEFDSNVGTSTVTQVCNES